MNSRISIKGLHKAFAEPVLIDVNLDIAPGSIHGLVGENGAGKSTLIYIISRLLESDRGLIFLDGKKYIAKSRRDSLDQGIALVSQELSLIDTLTVSENICLMALPNKYLTVDKKVLRDRTHKLIELVGLEHVSPHASVASLTLAEKQLVELAKALSLPESRAKLLILDEPTSALSADQADRLHQIIKDRAAEGLSVIYVSHRLEDVLEISDTVSVLRDGEVVLQESADRLTRKTLIEAMSGEELLGRANEGTRKVGPLRLTVDSLSSPEFPKPISLHCHSSEILGIAGLAGSGRSELLHMIFGLGESRVGRVLLEESGSQMQITSPDRSVEYGMALIPEDRKTQGIFKEQSVSFNAMIAGLGKGLGMLLSSREHRSIEDLMDRLNVKRNGPSQKIDKLSGGNQQKILMVRWLNTRANVWLLDEPTRGIDVNSKVGIHDQLRLLRDQGAALMVVSSDLEELMALCDRIMVLSEKTTVATFKRGEWTKEQLLEAAFSGKTNQKNGDE